MKRLSNLCSLLLIPICSLYSIEVGSAELFAEIEASSRYTSNVYLTRQEEWDLTVAPSAGLGVDFADFWTLGYTGFLEAYTRHRDLLYHKHELYLLLNPAWGEEGENEALVDLSVETQRNTDTYASINYVRPKLDLMVEMEPVLWFRWSLSEEVSYRWFYDDVASDSVDSWTTGSITFTVPSRTTISPRVAYGHRYYTRQDRSQTTDTMDRQIEAGVHLSQGLWESAGLQAGYVYVHAIGQSGLVLRKLTSTQFSYIGEEFLFTGHRAYLGFKQVFDVGLSFWLGADYEFREYEGWSVIDSDGNPTGEQRQDNRIGPGAWIEYGWWPDDEASSATPEVRVTLQYSYLRQLSNDWFYDTDQHVVGLSLNLAW